MARSQAQRFDQQVAITRQNLTTGAAQGLQSLAGDFQRFSQQAAQEFVDQRVIQAEEAGRAAFVEGQAPQFREEDRFIGGATAKAFNRGLRHSYLASLGNDIRQDLASIETANETDIAGYMSAISANRAALAKEVDPFVRNEVLQSFDEQATTGRIRVERNQAAKLRKESLAQGKAHLDQVLSDAERFARAGDDQASAIAIQEGIAATDSMVESGLITDTQAAEQKTLLNRKSAEQKFIGQLERQAEAEGTQAAFQSIDDLPEEAPEGFTQNEWDTFKGVALTHVGQIERLNDKLAAELTIEQSRQISDLKVSAKNGLDEPAKILEQTEEFFNKGMITEAERTSIINNLYSFQRQQKKQDLDFSAAAKRLAGDKAIVVEPRTVDAFYEQVYLPSIANDTPEKQQAKRLEYVNRMKDVPDQMHQEITTALQSEDPDLIRQASVTMDQIDNIHGVSEREFSVHERAFAEQVVALSANLDPTEAVDLARRNTDPNNEARVKARAAIIKAEKLPDTYRKQVEDNFSGIFGIGTKVDDINGDQMAKEYGLLFEEYFKGGMSQTGAQNKAMQIVQRNWSVSEVTGRVMKHAPDNFYAVNGDVSYIRDDLANFVNREVILPQDMFPNGATADQLFLQSTEATDRSASTGEPVYTIVAITDEGSLFPIYEMPWKPDQQAQIDELRGLNQEELNRRRQEAISRQNQSLVEQEVRAGRLGR